jgi:CHAT domain-containing protein/Tfp pilus assembly protein PilF
MLSRNPVLLGLAAAGLLLACRPEPAAVVVDSVTQGGAAARTGLRPGDALLSWRRSDPQEADGRFSSCAEVSGVEIEEAPRGPVELRVRRGEEVTTVAMPAGEWKLQVRAAGADDPAASGCAALVRARGLAGKRRWEEANGAFEEAVRRVRDGGGASFEAAVHHERGLALLDQGDLAAAEAALQESLRLRQGAAPGSLAEAASWYDLGRLARMRGELDRAEEALQTSERLRSRLAPASLERALTLNNLGIVAWAGGDQERARALYSQALGVARQRSPGSLEEAKVLNNLGLLARSGGDAAIAQRLFLEAGRIWARLEPQGTDFARNRANLGTLAIDRGDYAAAEAFLRDALARLEALSPESLESATVLNSLGIVARERFDFEQAEVFFQQSLAIRRKRVPGSFAEGESLSNLATAALERGRLDEAERFARQALVLRQRNAPDGPELATTLGTLAAIAARQGDLQAARELGEKAVAHAHRIAPGTVPESDLLTSLGTILIAREELREARSRLEESLAIRRRLAPGSWREASALEGLASASEKAGDHGEAERLLTTAVAALEEQIGRLGGSDESQSAFRSMATGTYRNLISVQITLGKPVEALHALERSRGRSLLALLAERDLAFRADVPGPLLDEQQRLDQDYGKTQKEIARTDPRETGEIDALLSRLTRLRNERAALVARITRASPRYASLRYPHPLDLAGIRRTLDPGTVWLSYCVTEADSYLFVVPAAKTGEEAIQVFTLPAGKSLLEGEVAVFRSLILRGRKDPRPEPALLAQGRKLYDLLIAPAAPWIAGADRVLISPDGALHTLPFAVLVQPGPRPSFLLEGKPLHTVLSATLYAELKRDRRPRRRGPVVAFADPLYRRASAGAGPDDPPLRRYLRGLPPLPGAREEVRLLTALYGTDAVVYLGPEASEKRVKNLAGRPPYLHFACHALLDPRFPLDSALALSVPVLDSEGDGLLQAWEIFERVRLDADLVTLSACETGLGRDAAGEGLIGLTRAFQYAGARSILASLWSVSDRSTAELMKRFYTLLRAGHPKDLALQAAQREMVRAGGASSHPYHWAAFELIGDWR